MAKFHFDLSVALDASGLLRKNHDHPTSEGEAFALSALHALSLRRILAAGETRGARAADYELFVVLHAAIFRALQEEQEIDRLMQANSSNPASMFSPGNSFA